jgi:hypothetical protein
MAFRIEAAISACLILGAGAAVAQPFTYQVRHQHIRNGAMGTLRVTLDSISFDEPGKKHQHSREWKYDEIQQLSLSPTELRILTYEDRKWQLGRDRDYVFDHLPDELAKTLYPMFAAKLDQRFIAELSDPVIRPQWQMPVKLRHGLSGSEGTLVVSDDHIAYSSDTAGESRVWRFTDIDSISMAGPFDFSITTLERAGWRHTAPTEFRFELKEPLAENRYNDLWRKLEEVKSRTAF